MKPKNNSGSGSANTHRAYIIRDLPPLYGSKTVKVKKPRTKEKREKPENKTKTRRTPREAIEKQAKLAADRKARAVELFNEGKKCAEIAEITGFGYSTVCTYVKEINPNAKHKEKLNEELIRLYEEGLKQKEIAERLGLTVSNTSQRLSLLRKRGLIGRRKKWKGKS